MSCDDLTGEIPSLCIMDEEVPFENFSLQESERLFLPGERVFVFNRWWSVSPEDEFFEALEIPVTKGFATFSEIPNKTEGIVLKVKPYGYDSRPLYIVESEGKTFFIFQSGLRQL